MTDTDLTGMTAHAGLLEPGTIFAEKFEVLSKLGEGGMSVVYKARQLNMGRDVALKVLHGRMLADSKAYQRFRREAQVISTLHHPNIVRVLVLQTDATQPYMAMDLIDGGSLADYLQGHGRISADEAVALLTQAAHGLGHAHDQGIIHRDVKPANIMLKGAAKQVQVVDFGVAQLMEADPEAQQKLTQTDGVIGTPYYMSPEQCEKKPLDARSDIYALGCVLYQMLNGKPPFRGDSPYAVMFEQIHTPPPELPHNVPAWLRDVCMRMLAKNPDDRFENMRELVAALEQRKTERRSAPLVVASRSSFTKQMMLIVACAMAIVAAPFVAVQLMSYAPQRTTNIGDIDFETAQQAYDAGEDARKRWLSSNDPADKNSAQRFYRRAAQMARQEHKWDFVAQSLWRSGMAWGNPDGKDDARQAIAVYKEQGIRNLASDAYFETGLDKFEQFQKTFNEVPFSDATAYHHVRCDWLRQIATNNNQKNYAKCVEFAKKWLNEANALGDADERLRASVLLADSYMALGQINEAKALSTAELNSSVSSEDPADKLKAIGWCAKLRDIAYRPPGDNEEVIRVTRIALNLENSLLAAGVKVSKDDRLANMFILANTLWAAQKYQEGLKEIEPTFVEVQKLKPYDIRWVVAYDYKAKNLAGLKKFAEADRCYAKACEKIAKYKLETPISVWTLSDRAFTAAGAGNFELAISVMESEKRMIRTLIDRKDPTFTKFNYDQCDIVLNQWKAALAAQANHGA